MKERSSLGAASSRIGAALGVLRTSADNFDEAASRITDTDIAAESANAVKAQILSQVSAAMLAQANQEPYLVLDLLKASLPGQSRRGRY